MRFYDVSNTEDSMVHYVLFLLGGITTTDYPLADIARSTNTAKYQLALKIMQEQDGWDFQDGGQTDFPIATTALVDDQTDYSLPADILEIRRLEVKDANGNWTKLEEIDETNVREAMDEYKETKGIPVQYRLEAGSLMLYPAADTTIMGTTASLKITYNRAIKEFTAATTTTEVGIGESGDRVVAYQVAEEWAGVYRPDRLPTLQARRTELETQFISHMSDREKDGSNNLSVIYDNNE